MKQNKLTSGNDVASDVFLANDMILKHFLDV